MKTAPTVTITLDYPINIDGIEVKTLSLRRMKVADQMAAEKLKGNDAEKEIALLANLCEMSPDDIQQLDIMDYAKLQAQLVNFHTPEQEQKSSGEPAQK